jgi:hypothetical protein
MSAESADRVARPFVWGCNPQTPPGGLRPRTPIRGCGFPSLPCGYAACECSLCSFRYSLITSVIIITSSAAKIGRAIEWVFIARHISYTTKPVSTRTDIGNIHSTCFSSAQTSTSLIRPWASRYRIANQRVLPLAKWSAAAARWVDRVPFGSPSRSLVMIVLATPVIRVGGITMSSSAPRNCSPPSMPLSVTAIANTRSVRSVPLLCSVLVMVCSSGRRALGHSPPAAGTRARLFYGLALLSRLSRR